ncbi:transcriptional regulator NrdR family protein [Erwinia persicina]|uniref:Ogr/Delta-like zinc finger family protein n=3 Tax=Erwinia TaxID=551 RepID=A0A328TYN2_9GAMM|nr:MULTISPECIES: ogr/Delta-like zinc finger family protein [Erwinia]MCP1438376.1 transcriptional regulator NrdR family protein [Erwinia persicina]MCX8962689.1 transcriptional regulator [Erwinia psidii]MDN8542004.1 ogr/Delta-like zinc finger family protein [Erwinia sp. BC051422]RAP72856.1 ogr/Delta-like zinc finger family protein [Candidatus Erwinia dacicola]RQM36867.1 transcriptional regulator [Erwinia psidii]
MMHCPLCQTAAHAKSSRYISRETKERYHQCQNINCSCTFKTHESIAGMIVSPGQTNKVPIFTHNDRQPSLLH